MSLANNFKFYQEEIDLIQAQNKVECDLYSLIAPIIRENTKNISLRDVSTRRGSDFSRVFCGNSGFPDFIIRTREKNNGAKILGAIEIKYVSKDLDKKKYLEQLQGHLQSYNKVIYTNGIDWRFYDKSMKQKWSRSLATIKSNKLEWKSEDEWNALLNDIRKIQWLDD